MSNGEERRIPSQIALGNIAPDTVIENGTIFNAFTKEIIEKQSIWIKDGWIVYVGSDYDPKWNDRTVVIDVDSMNLLPELIEGHTHLSRS